MAVINGPGIFAWAQALPGSNRYTIRETLGSTLSPPELTYANLLVNSRKCKQKRLFLEEKLVRARWRIGSHVPTTTSYNAQGPRRRAPPAICGFLRWLV